MSYRLNIRPEAEADVAEAALWNQQRKLGLGDEFITEAIRQLGEFRKIPSPFGLFDAAMIGIRKLGYSDVCRWITDLAHTK
jgi:hypothetical protein